MTEYDELFEEIQEVSDHADELGLTDVALVLEFALDVLLRDTEEMRDREPTPVEIITAAAEKLKTMEPRQQPEQPIMQGSMSTFPLLAVHRVAS